MCPLFGGFTVYLHHACIFSPCHVGGQLSIDLIHFALEHGCHHHGITMAWHHLQKNLYGIRFNKGGIHHLSQGSSWSFEWPTPLIVISKGNNEHRRRTELTSQQTATLRVIKPSPELRATNIFHFKFQGICSSSYYTIYFYLITNTAVPLTLTRENKLCSSLVYILSTLSQYWRLAWWSSSLSSTVLAPPSN